MYIQVKYLNQKTITLDVSDNDKISEVKQKIQEKEGIPIAQQKLMYAGKELLNFETLFSQNILNESIIHLIQVITDSMQIFIKFITGKCIILNVQPNDFIKDVKQQIYEKEQIPPYEQRLVCGQEFKDEKTLSEYNIKENFIMYFVFKQKAKKEILCVMQTGKIKKLYILYEDLIESVKSQIQDYEGIPPNQQRLYFNGIELQSQKTFSYYNIQREYTIFLNQNKIRIFRDSFTQEQIYLDLETNDTIKNVKQKIYEEKGIHPNEQLFLEEDQEIEDERKISQINKQSYLKLLSRYKYMKIFVESFTGENFDIYLEKNCLVSNLKVKLTRKLNLSPNQLKLNFKGQILENEKTLQDYNIQQESTINVNDTNFNIFLLFLKIGKEIPLKTYNFNTIYNIKTQIQNQEGIPIQQQILIFQGQEQDDECTLEECNINDGCNLLLALRKQK